MIQSARASYIRSFYVCQCRVFEEWYARAQKIPFQCSVCAILSFQQDLTDNKKGFLFLFVCFPKVELAAISAKI